MGLWQERNLTFLATEQPVDPITKRTVLKYVASIFDPIGFVSPVILQGRNIIQECCRINLDWDSELPLDLLNPWHKFVNSIKSLNFTIPRCLRSGANCNSIELHTFVDCSETGYGSVSYLTLCFMNFILRLFLRYCLR